MAESAAAPLTTSVGQQLAAGGRSPLSCTAAQTMSKAWLAPLSLLSSAARRVSEGFHKRVEEYRERQARHQARRGNLLNAMRHAEKPWNHDLAEQKQRRKARVKEKTVKTG